MRRASTPPPVERTCHVCSVTFHIPAFRARQGRGQTCSRRCKMIAARDAITTIVVTPTSTVAERIRAQGLVNHRVKAGKMPRPDRCQQCAKVGRVDGHHEDYSRPAEVEWLCRSCHMKRHHKPQKKAS